MLEYEAFVDRLLILLELEPSDSTNPYDSLYEDVGLDSLQAFQLIVIIEALADATPTDDLPELYTMRDAYDYYTMLRGARA